jgi:hypothetical protein
VAVSPQCATCRRTLVSRDTWRKMTRADRKRLHRTHNQVGIGGNLCHGCWQADRRMAVGNHPDLAYGGDWVPVKGVMRPTIRRAS